MSVIIYNNIEEGYLEDFYNIKEKVEDSSARYQGEPVDFLYQPVIFTEEDLLVLKNLTRMMTGILKKVIGEYRNNPDFRNRFGFPTLMEELILSEPGYNCEFPIARFDIFYSQRGGIKFCELNADGSSGMNEERVLQDLFYNSKIVNDIERNIGELKKFELFASWVDIVLAKYDEFKRENPDYPTEPNIAIVDFKGEGVVSEFRVFKEYFEARGYTTIICDPSELGYDGDRLYYRGKPIDLVYRRVTTGRLIERSEEATDFIEAYREQAVCLVGGIVSQIIHNKVLFALLSNREALDFLTEPELSFLAAHIPRTNLLVESDIKEKVVRDKNRYIIKPLDKCACKGVYAGRNYSRDKWLSILEQIDEEFYLVQEYCQVPEYEMLSVKNNRMNKEKFNFILGLYMYDQKLQGFYPRVGRKDVIGARIEAFTLPAYILD